MGTKKCPGCGSRVPSDEMYCPNCPHSFKGEEHGIQRDRRGRDYARPLGLLAAFAVAGAVAWRILSFVLSMGDHEINGQYATQPKVDLPTFHYSMPAAPKEKPGLPADGAKLPEQPATEAEPEAILLTPVAPPEPEPAPSSARGRSGRKAPRSALSAASAASAAPVAPREWKFRGSVYDLTTLKPLPGVTVILQAPAYSRRFETMTDDHGQYRAALPPLPSGGYIVTLDRGGYASGYLSTESGDPSARDEDERRKLARQVARSFNPPETVEGGPEPLIHDYFLAPLKLK